MFGQDHEAEDVATRIDHLMNSVFDEDDEARLASLRRHVAPDFVYISPEAVFEGPVGLSEAFAMYRCAERRPVILRRTSALDLHHGYFRYRWQRLERGGAAMEGWSSARSTAPERSGGSSPSKGWCPAPQPGVSDVVPQGRTTRQRARRDA